MVLQMIDDQDLGFFANFLGIFIFVLVIAYHYVMADPKYEGNWKACAVCPNERDERKLMDISFVTIIIVET